MNIRRACEIVAAVVIGIALARGTSAGLGYMLEEPEIRNYQPGQPLFNHPVSEAYAQLVNTELQQKLERDAVIRRFDAAHSWPVIAAISLVAFLVDPLNLAMAAIFGFVAFFGIKRARVANEPTIADASPSQ